MHAIRGTVGYDPTPIDPEAKRASRTRFFANLSDEAQATAGAIERNVERIAEQRRLEAIVASGKHPAFAAQQRAEAFEKAKDHPGFAAYRRAKALYPQPVAEQDDVSPQSTADLPAYGISD